MGSMNIKMMAVKAEIIKKSEDPFVTQIPDVLDQILDHFSAKELMEASQVSPVWHEYIANSSSCMSRVKIVIDCNTPEIFCEKVVDVSKSSMRYQNLDLRNCSTESDILGHLFYPIRNLRRISFTNILLEDFKQFLAYMKCVSETIEELTLLNVALKSPSKPEGQYCDFPQLREFSVKMCEPSLFQIFFKTKNIRCLSIDYDASCKQGSQELIKIMKRNHKLTSLILDGDIFKEIFDDYRDVEKYHFKLKQISVRCDLEHEIYNFARFLRSQDELDQIEMHSMLGLNAIHEIFCLPILRTFRFLAAPESYQGIDWKFVKFPASKSIVNFTFIYNNIYDPSVKALMSGISLKKEICVADVDQSALELMARTVPNIVDLYIRNFTATDLSKKDLFPNLKKLVVFDWKSPEDTLLDVPTLHETIIEKKEEDRSHVEKLFVSFMENKEALINEYLNMKIEN